MGTNLHRPRFGILQILCGGLFIHEMLLLHESHLILRGGQL